MLYKLRQVISRGRRDDMPPADGSSTRGGSTSVRGRVRSPHMAKSQPTNNLVHIGVKTCISCAAVFVDFPKNKCNFLHKNMFDILRRVQFLAGRLPMRSCFSPGAVATIALWKSAPVLKKALVRTPALGGNWRLWCRSCLF